MERTMTFILILLAVFSAAIFADGLTRDEANELVYKLYKDPGSGTKPKVQKLIGPVNGLYAALVRPPYREFPNVVLFQLSKQTGKWETVYEALAPGIDPQTSETLDLHTLEKGVAVDLVVPDWKTVDLNNPQVKKFINAAVEKRGKGGNGLVVVPYTYFLHAHELGDVPYTIDKTGYYGFAVKLKGKQYTGYPKDNCMMYDMPGIAALNMEYKDGKYVVTATTMNRQEWTYTFTGVADDGYLKDKKITVVAYKGTIP